MQNIGESKKEKTYRLIISKASQLFNEKGYAGTSLSDIMVATGLQKGGIYGHFKSKKDIAIASFTYIADKIFRSLNNRSSNNLTYKERLYNMLEDHKNLYKMDFLKNGCPLLNTAIEVDDTEPELLQLVKKYLDRWKLYIITLIEKGQKNNEIAQSIVAEDFASTYITFIEGANFMAKVYGDDIYRDNAIEQLKKIIDKTF